jgi:dTDP-4-amino-4,6-dideoxygalactose transaminase
MFSPESSLFPVNRGRVALTLALRALARLEPRRREVVYPAYVCAAVIEAIVQAGLVPVPADVGGDLNLGLNDAEAVASADTLAIIAVHTYGCPAPIVRLEEFCRHRGIFLIDDAANIAGIRHGGRVLGAFGDAGIMSFTASKSIVAGGFNAGGLLLVNNPDLVDAMRREWEALTEARYRLGDFLLYLRDLRFEPYTQRAVYYYAALRRRVLGDAPRHRCPPTLMPNVSAAVALRQLESLHHRIAGRIRVAELYSRHLAGLPGVRFPQYAPDRYLTRIMVQLPERSDDMRITLSRAGVDTGRPYSLDHRFGSVFPKIARIAPLLLQLPSHSQMTEASVRAICAALRASVAGHARIAGSGGSGAHPKPAAAGPARR